MQNNNTSYKFIEVVPYSGLVNWSVQYLKDSSITFNKKYPLVTISSFLKRNKTAFEIENNKEYKRATIKVRNGGIFIRDIEKGQNIGTKNQFLIKEGQFLLSKIDARNGAFGVVPAELEGGIITGNFWTFDVDYSKVNPHYLSLVATTPEFIKFSEQASNGTTNRHYLQEDAFLNIKIPLPSKNEQNRIVAAYQLKIQLAEEQELKSIELEKDIENYLINELGININKKDKNKGLGFISYKNISRWDYQFFYSQTKINSNYKTVKLEQCFDKFLINKDGKSLRIETNKQPDKDFLYVGMESVEKETGELLELPIVKGKDIKSQTVRIPKDYFIYGKLRPYLNKYWFNETENVNIICSSEFFVFSILGNINKQYFKNVLGSVIIQRQIDESTSGARMPRINEQVFSDLILPIPPLDIQNKIANHISEIKTKIKQLKQQAEQNRILALQEFENEIFKN
jgi:restriction endonuclease S subunit